MTGITISGTVTLSGPLPCASTGMTIVSDRPTLSSTASTAGVVWLSEDGRQGWFEWESTDLSALVAIDTAQGLYVPPSSDISGASGAWVRRFSGPLNVKWFGAKGDYDPGTATGADDTAAIQAAISVASDLGGRSVFVPVGTYKTTSTIYLKGVGGFYGESNQRPTVSKYDIGGSSIYAVHSGAGVLSLKGAGFVSLNNLTIEAAEGFSPKAGLILGRDTAASAGNHRIEKIVIRGNYSVSCIYSIASEEVVYENVYAWLYDGSTGFAVYYNAEQDTFSVDGLVTSTNVTAYFFGCAFINGTFDDGGPSRTPSVVYLDFGENTGGTQFSSCYLIANEGAYITLNNYNNTSETIGPFVFNGVSGERLGADGDPSHGLKITSSVPVSLRGLTWVGSRFNFIAGDTKKAASISSNVTLFNPMVVINPEEAFPYATIEVDYGKIKGGVFAVGREGHWKSMALAGSWVNAYGGSYQQAEYKIAPDHKVCLRGEIQGGTGLITTLPPEARPRSLVRAKALSDAGVCIVTVSETTGAVTLVSGSGTGLCLNTISFYRD